MTDTEFDSLTTECLNARDAYVANLAVLSAENAQLKTALARSEFARQASEQHNADLVKRLMGMKSDLLPKLPKGNPDSIVVHGVHWGYCDLTVDVELGFDTPESVWLRGADISSAVAAYPHHVMSRLNEIAKEQHDKDEAEAAAYHREF